MDFIQIANQFKERSLSGRYITLQHIQPLLEQDSFKDGLSIIGKSVQNRPIYSYKIGVGTVKILMWSQMHGNETTTTKALFDLFNFLHSDDDLAVQFKKKYSFCFIPILNPDGAFAYTRENANAIDLNRDAQTLSEPESKLLKSVFINFKPDYCFNLHDQRSIYGVGDSSKAAVISFLAPSFNDAKEINATRTKAIKVIAAIYDTLSVYIPGEIGRFDDSFNLNCVGDTFQFLETPTILFEAGHSGNDYERENTRALLFISYLSALISINDNDIVFNNIDKYLAISQNKVNFYDFLYINTIILSNGIKKITNFAIQYQEELIDGNVQFIGVIAAVNNLDNYFGHTRVDCHHNIYSDFSNNIPEVGAIANFCLNDVKIFTNGKLVV